VNRPIMFWSFKEKMEDVEVFLWIHYSYFLEALHNSTPASSFYFNKKEFYI